MSGPLVEALMYDVLHGLSEAVPVDRCGDTTETPAESCEAPPLAKDVFFEAGLTLAIPLAVAFVAGLCLQAAGIGY
jgi:hypothetical protein